MKCVLLSKKGILFIFILLVSQVGRSQNFVKDSLAFINQIEQLKLKNDTLELCRKYYKLGALCDDNEKRTSAYLYLNKALELSTAMRYGKATVTIANRLACLYSEEGEHEKALGIYYHCIDLLKESGDTNRMPTILMNIGDEYEIIGDYSRAIEYKLKGLRLKEELKDSLNIAVYYLYIGMVYKTSGNDQKWKYYLDIANSLKHNSFYADSVTVSLIYENLALYFRRSNDYDRVMQYYDSLYNYAKSHFYIKGIYKSLCGKALLLSDMGKHTMALKYIDEAMFYLPEEQELILNNNNLVGQIYIKNNQYDKAVNYLTKSLNGFTINEFPVVKLETYKLLYMVLKKKNSFEQALSYYEKFVSLSDSLKDTEMMKKVQEIETKYQTEKKEQEINQLTARNEIQVQRINFAVAAIIALILAVVLTIIVLIIRRRKAQIVEEGLKQKLFISQMNPHFIFNALASIQNYLYKNQPKVAAGFLSNFSSLTRSILVNSTKESITLEEEIETLRNYIKLEQMRLKSAFSFEIKFEEDIETGFINIPPMLIQPFVENAIKHGLKDKKEDGILTITFTDKQDLIKVQVKDNGIGIEKSMQQSKNGYSSMALTIFNQRMQIIQKRYRKIPKPSIEDLSHTGSQGTLVEISIPVIDNN